MAKNRPWNPWRPKEDKQLACWVGDYEALAVILGRSIQGILCRKRRLGLSERRMPRAEAAEGWPMAYEVWEHCEIAYLRANKNEDMDEITWRLGRSPRAILNKLTKLRLSRRCVAERRGSNRTLAERVWRARMAGAENWQVAQRFGISSDRASSLFWIAKQRQGGVGKSR